jgi:hypothetical protein
MDIKTKTIRQVHTPYKLIFKNQIHEIVKIDRKFVIKDYKIVTVNGKIDSIILNNPHPNANPKTGEFCIPKTLRQLEVNANTLQMINTMLCCFNLDSCYFTPWDEIEYQKQEVIGAWKTTIRD